MSSEISVKFRENISRLAVSYANDPWLKEKDWSGLAVVVRSMDGFDDISKMYGIVYYSSGEYESIRVDMDSVEEAYIELLESSKSESGQNWIASLFQLQRLSGKTRLLLEFEDSTRWAATPQNLGQIPDLIRPNFDGPSNFDEHDSFQ